MTDVGVSNDERQLQVARHNSASCRVLCVGKLEHWRGFDIAIEAFAMAVHSFPDMTLVIVGGGPDESRLRRIAEFCDTTEQTVFTGHVTQEKFQQLLLESSIYLHPYGREGGVTSLMEAMRLGVPVICLDIGGANDNVSERCGFRIQVSTFEETRQRLANALVKIASNWERRDAMGANAENEIMAHTWRRKVSIVVDKFQELCHICSNK